MAVYCGTLYMLCNLSHLGWVMNAQQIILLKVLDFIVCRYKVVL